MARVSKFIRIALACTAGLLLSSMSLNTALAQPAPAAAATGGTASPTPLGQSGDWQSYSFQEDGGTVCYMASKPTKSQGAYKSRGEIFALVTHRPARNSRDVVSFIAGYTYKPDTSVRVTIGSDTFTLFSQGENAWTPDDATDKKLSEAIRKGSTMVVKGTSSRGTETTDTYSLKGTGDAYASINKACGLE